MVTAEKIINPPLISVCIPAYNRASVLSDLLDTIINQDFENYEIIISEDCSPERDQIRKIVEQYQGNGGPCITYSENEINLGYDGNLRHLFELATGDYIFFMGNDDLMCKDALQKVANAVLKYPNIGVVLRSYQMFDGEPENITQTFKYFKTERFFENGVATISTIYRRSVVIPGMVFHRKSALKVSTKQYDGTLLYQLYLVAQILITKNAVSIPDIIVLYREGGIPDFGNSEAEKGKFVAQEQTPESSILFVDGLVRIAKEVGEMNGIPIFKPIFKDLANYSYPFLSIQAEKSKISFLKYAIQLSRLGFYKFPIYWLYVILIIIIGEKYSSRIIIHIKNILGCTPILGKVYQGEVYQGEKN